MKKIRIIDDKKQWLPIYCVANLFLIQYLESHSTWVRELKFFDRCICGHHSSRTPRECVSWNWFQRRIILMRREVALHVSAWVEISLFSVVGTTGRSHSTWVRELKYGWTLRKALSDGRTPRECVSWNSHYSTKWSKWQGRTPRECVSWNPIRKHLELYPKCRTPRECVSWNTQRKGTANRKRVALHVSAWVEICCMW